MLYAEEPPGSPVLQEIDSRKYQEKGTVIAQIYGSNYHEFDDPLFAN